MAKAIVAVSIMLVGMLVIAQGMSSIIKLLASCVSSSYAAKAGRVPPSPAACSNISCVRQVAALRLWPVGPFQLVSGSSNVSTEFVQHDVLRSED